MLQDHVRDSIREISLLPIQQQTLNSAYHQLVRLTRAAAAVCGIDYDAELAVAYLTCVEEDE